MIFVGVDQSYTNTGLVAIRDNKILDIVSLKIPKDYIGIERIHFIYDRFINYCRYFYQKDNFILAAIEGAAFGKAFRAHQMGELAGAIALAFFINGVPVKRYPPKSHRKLSLGYGLLKGSKPKEKKEYLVSKINQKYGKKFKVNIEDHNIADAFSIVQALMIEWNNWDEKFFKNLSPTEIDIIKKVRKNA